MNKIERWNEREQLTRERVIIEMTKDNKIKKVYYYQTWGRYGYKLTEHAYRIEYVEEEEE